MTDPRDPLGRIDAQQLAPYPHPAVSSETMVQYWRRLYREEAAALPDGELAAELGRATEAVAQCEAAIRDAEVERHRLWTAYWDGAVRDENGFAFVGPADAANARSDANAAVTATHVRLVRLTGRRSALAAEAKRRGLSGTPG